MRTASVSKIVVPTLDGFSPSTGSGKALAPVDRQRRAAARRHRAPPSRRPPARARHPQPRPCRRLTHAGSGTFASARPAAMSSAIQPAISLQPAACQVSNGPYLPAEAPADREVDVARVVGDRRQMIGAVVEQVAEDRPQELRLRMRASRAACANFSAGDSILRIAATSGATSPAAGAVVARGRIQHLDFLAGLAEEPGLGLCAERALARPAPPAPAAWRSSACHGSSGKRVAHRLRPRAPWCRGRRHRRCGRSRSSRRPIAGPVSASTTSKPSPKACV